ncbi:MAG: hypothetical protein JWN40_488 [Phycisphaerales bacterium]|nr:hypothetical protein [Phycisphaerales bacterium]
MNQTLPPPPRPTTARTLRFIGWIALVLVLLPGQLLWLWSLRGANLLTHESTLIWGQVIIGSATVALLALLKTTPANALRLSPRTSAALVIAGTILLQASAVFLLAPVLSDDIFRYRIDGRMWLAQSSPYATSPEHFLATHPHDPADELVPYRDWRTVYPPVSQAVFAAARWLDDALTNSPPHATTTMSTDHRPWRIRATDPAVVRQTLTFRALFALFAIGSTILLIRILIGAGDSAWWAAVLAWNPLLTLETGGMGHQDAIGLFLLLLMIYAARTRHYRAAAVALALACGVKPVAALLLPFLWRQTHEEHSFRAGRRMLLVFAIALALVFLPLAWQHGWTGWRQSLTHFGHSWEANGYLYESFKSLFGEGDQGRQMERAKDAARLLTFLAVLAMGLFLWQSRARLPEAGYWLFMVLLLCAPVAYPWYLIWVLAFIPLLRGPQGYAGLVWAATAAISYTLWRDATWIWSVRPTWLTAEYLPVLCVLTIEAIRLARIVPMRRILHQQTSIHFSSGTPPALP